MASMFRSVNYETAEQVETAFKTEQAKKNRIRAKIYQSLVDEGL